MASDDAGLATDGAAAYAERGVEGLAETWHDDVVYEEDPLFPGAATYHGREAALARFREYEEQLGPSTVVIESVDQRDDHVLVVWRHSGVTSGAELPFEHRWAWVVRLRDGKAAHIRAYVDPDEALRAAATRARR